jgi:hypothetical protein
MQKYRFKSNTIAKDKIITNVIIGGIVMLLLLGLLYRRYRLKQRSNIQMQQKQQEINRELPGAG